MEIGSLEKVVYKKKITYEGLFNGIMYLYPFLIRTRGKNIYSVRGIT